MIVISLRVLKQNFLPVASQFAKSLSEKKGYDKNEVFNKLNSTSNFDEFKKIFEEYFGDEVIIDIKEK